MIRLNIHQAKTHLSRYLPQLAQGEVLLLCKRNRPVAEIRGVPPESLEPRPIGLAKGQFRVPADLNDPLPADLLTAFEVRAAAQEHRDFVVR